MKIFQQEKVISAFQSEPIEGENVIDVLVTVGKAYEGLMHQDVNI